MGIGAAKKASQDKMSSEALQQHSDVPVLGLENSAYTVNSREFYWHCDIHSETSWAWGRRLMNKGLSDSEKDRVSGPEIGESARLLVVTSQLPSTCSGQVENSGCSLQRFLAILFFPESG